MIGAAGLLLLYLVLIGRGLRIAMERTDAFGKLLATGLTTVVALQTFAIVGGRDAAHPAHRRAAAPRVLRGVEPGRDVRHARAPGAHLGRVRGSDRVDRRIRRLGIALVALFGLLFAQLAYVQVFAASRISGNPANASRQIIAEYKVDRGAILSRDRPRAGRERRRERQVRLRSYRRDVSSRGRCTPPSPATTRGSTAAAQLEQAMNDYLAGNAPELAVSNFTDLILGRPKKGGSVVTTIQSQLQAAAQQALGTLPGRRRRDRPTHRRHPGDGREPVVRPQPALLGHERPDAARTGRSSTPTPPRRCVSRAKDQLYLPGLDLQDDHRVGGAAERLRPRQHLAQPARAGPAADERARCENFGNELCAGGAKTVTMAEAFTRVVQRDLRAEIGLKLGAEQLQAQAQALRVLPHRPARADHVHRSPRSRSSIPFQTGRFPIPAYFEQNDPLLAFSAIGLDNVAHEPAADGAGGRRDREPGHRDAAAPGDARSATRRAASSRSSRRRSTGGRSPRTAHDDLRQMMINVVEHGTGYSAQIPGTTVAGKTGTATNGPGHAAQRVVRVVRAGRRRTGPAASPWRLSFWTAATWATRRRAAGWRRRSPRR